MQHTPGSRCLIVNADDFGLTTEINRGIVEARECGILTSASLMVRGSAAAEAADYARQNADFSVGLHFEVAEWRFQRGEWVKHYEVIDSTDPNAVRLELERQLALFAELAGRLPTHLDSHQHMHLKEPARSILIGTANQLRVPLRSCTPEIRYSGGFYGQTGEGEPYAKGISLDHLIHVIETLPAGWTEVGTHPGYAGGLDSVYTLPREEELRVLCRREVRAAMERTQVQLCSFHDVRL